MHQLEQVRIVPPALADDVDDEKERGCGLVRGRGEELPRSRVVCDKVIGGWERRQ